MKSRLLIVTLVCMILAISAAPISADASSNHHRNGHEGYLSPAAVKLKEDLRRLWIDHVVLTRNYIVSAVAGLEDQQVVLDRLLKNQQDIGNAFKPYYGEAAGNKIAELLKEHISIAGQLLTAMKSGNQADADKFNKVWHKNGDDIAAFLSSANPNWTNKQLQEMFYVHLQLVTDTMMARLTKDWKADIVALDKGEDHMIMFADILSDGVIKQFPKQFN
ncbi:glycosyltransferase [Bacillus sp. FJAT-26390]|uniref:glycosyltransferase n=1 Tax=Bacillus sp. FJAT-26390 TaxID=1743142 RepID=UPI000807F025|nr:glycosyltransferase [Bacillus sp. FJAT-26390]OBZ10213.1 glycosyltransferase [Bacillus sp. FJAT-26390]